MTFSKPIDNSDRPPREPVYVRIKHVRFLHSTGKAFLVREEPEVGDREIWIPIYAVRNFTPPHRHRGTLVEFDCLERIAIEKELHYE